MTRKRHIGTLIDRKLKAAAILDPKAPKSCLDPPSAEKMLLRVVALIKIYSGSPGWNPLKTQESRL